MVKFPVTGGSPVTVGPLTFGIYGGWWGNNGWIYFGTEAPHGIVKLDAGGFLHGATDIDNKEKREVAHRFPELLPGGKWIVLTVRNANHRNFDQSDIQVAGTTDHVFRTVAQGTAPHYASSGHLLFVRAGVLMAMPFDPATAQPKGAAVPVVEGIMENPRTGAAQYAVSPDGTLVYLPGGAVYPDREVIQVDRSGAIKVLTAKKRPYEDLMLSPDGRLLAMTIGGPERDTWIHDIARDTDTQFTKDNERGWPSWSADGKHVMYCGFDHDGYSIFWRPLDGTGKQEELVDADERPAAADFASRDGKYLLFDTNSDWGPHDITLLTLDKRIPLPYIATPPDEEYAQMSPDGRWVSYDSDESGRHEVYVSPVSDVTTKTKVSTNGGRHAQWSPNGKELFYLEDPTPEAPRPYEHRVRLMAAAVDTSSNFKNQAPHALFDGPFYESVHDYAVTPDGKFLFLRTVQPAAGSELRVVLGWTEELRHKVH